jgi:RNA polymerase sigma-70 factor (ECF subfamily)
MENEAFDRMVTEHKDRVHSYATMMLRDAAEAQDVAQETLVRLWQNRGQVRPEAARPWMMRTAYNLCIDRIRRRKVRGEVGEPEEIVNRQPDHGPDPGRLAESSELGAVIQKALEALAPMDRAVIVMREVQGLPYDEIASALGLPLGTLKARLHRARERLRDRLSRIGVKPWLKTSNDAA